MFAHCRSSVGHHLQSRRGRYRYQSSANIGGGYFDKIGTTGDMIGFAFFGVLSALLLRQALAKAT